MKEIIKNVLTFRYLWKAFIIICCTAVLVWITRGNLTRCIYMGVFGGWTLAYVYMRQTKSEDDLDYTDF